LSIKFIFPAEEFFAPSAVKTYNYPWLEFFPPEEKIKVGGGGSNAFVWFVKIIRNS